MKNLEEIEKLYNLKEKGVITEQEFENRKYQLLNNKQEIKTSKTIKILPLIVVLVAIIVGLYYYFIPIYYWTTYNWEKYKLQRQKTNFLSKIQDVDEENINNINIDEEKKLITGVYNGTNPGNICKEICLILSDAKLFGFYVNLKNSSGFTNGACECDKIEQNSK